MLLTSFSPMIVLSVYGNKGKSLNKIGLLPEFQMIILRLNPFRGTIASESESLPFRLLADVWIDNINSAIICWGTD